MPNKQGCGGVGWGGGGDKFENLKSGDGNKQSSEVCVGNTVPYGFNYF